jgi:ribonuclease BN (tRNA processing enzyme)
MKKTCWLIAMLLLALTPAHAGLFTKNEPEPRACEPQGMRLQALGSAGAEPVAGRAGASYLVWLEGKARALLDVSAATPLRLAETGAAAADLDAVLFTRLRAERTAGLPALVQAAALERRDRALPLYGPAGDRATPSTVTFVRALFDGTRGAWRHLGAHLNPLARDAYKLQPRDIAPRPRPLGMPRKPDDDPVLSVFANERLRLQAVPMPDGAGPALAWRIDAAGKRIVIAADGTDDAVARLAQGADLLVAQAETPEQAAAVGAFARAAGVKQLVLSARTRAMLGNESKMLEGIGKNYTGPAAFANDLDCFTP